jgi:hypothetical protein
MTALPRIPWQITGNHWLTLPCIHPADASIHCVGVVHAQSRGAIEFTGGADYIDGNAPPLMSVTIARGGSKHRLGDAGIAWERVAGWIPTFSSRFEDLTVRGIICAPHGRNADLAGFVFEIVIENRGKLDADLVVAADGYFGQRFLRVRSSREFGDESRASATDNESIVLQGTDARNPVALAIGARRGQSRVTTDGSVWSIEQSVAIPSGKSTTISFCLAAGQERDGAEAVLEVMRRRGPSSLVEDTRKVLQSIEPATGNPAADRLIARHMFFACFCSVARAIDDAHIYVMRSRIPWNPYGMTIRDWEALTWILPAVQLADSNLAREVLLRICDLHGYAPGSGVHYLDGSLFEPGFSLEGAAAFPIAVDEYIVHSGDDKVVEEPLLADSLYNAFEDIEARKHKTLPLYSTEVNPDGSVPDYPYTAHGNAVVALALDILSHTLDEKTAEKVQDPSAVRAALLRQFSHTDGSGKSVLMRASDLGVSGTESDGGSAALYWLPYYDLVGRDDSLYRRTVKPLETVETDAVFMWCGRLIGPNGARALEWLRRAPLDGGVASEIVDSEGRAVANGGDAALSGLLAYTAWYAVHALGVSI